MAKNTHSTTHTQEVIDEKIPSMKEDIAEIKKQDVWVPRKCEQNGHYVSKICD